MTDEPRPIASIAPGYVWSADHKLSVKAVGPNGEDCSAQFVATEHTEGNKVVYELTNQGPLMAWVTSFERIK